MSWSDKENSRKSVAVSIVPEWFIAGKNMGMSEAELYEKTRDFCKKTLEWENRYAAHSDKTEPDENWVKMAFELYQQFWRQG